MVEITYRTAMDRCRAGYIAHTCSLYTEKERRKTQFSCQAVLEVLTNTDNYAALGVLKETCEHCDFSRAKIEETLRNPETLSALEATESAPTKRQ